MSETSNIRAIGPRVLVRERALQSRDVNGIHVILREKDKLQSGEVLSVGNHPRIASLGIEVGQTVWYRRECGSEVGDDLVFLHADMLEASGQAQVVALTRRSGE